jgi:hypothetical protein
MEVFFTGSEGLRYTATQVNPGLTHVPVVMRHDGGRRGVHADHHQDRRLPVPLLQLLGRVDDDDAGGDERDRVVRDVAEQRVGLARPARAQCRVRRVDVERLQRPVRDVERDQWLSSDEASRIVLAATAAAVMLVSILWSMSRSGMDGTALALAILGAAGMYRLGSTAQKRIAVTGLLVLTLFAIGWRGAGTLAEWYGRTQTFEWRVQLWNDTLPALRDFWLVASGINTYGTVMLVYPQTNAEVHAQQAHNDYLQLAVEGGLLVGIPVLILVGLFVAVVRRRLAQPQSDMTWWLRMGAVAGICGIAVQSTVEFSLQIPGIAVLFAVLVAIAIHEPADVERRPRRPVATAEG